MSSAAVSHSMAQALALAAEVHSGQTWRDGASPFLAHPVAVASLVLRFGGDEEQAAAALVHDTIGDPRGSIAELERRLGADIARLAHAFADPEEPSPEPAADAWGAAKKAYLAKLRKLDARALLVVGAEELHELTDLLQELRRTPPIVVWKRYPTLPMNMAWYFKEVLSAILPKLTGPAEKGLVAEYAFRLKQLKELVFEGNG